MDAQVIRKLVPSEFYSAFFLEGLRPDDREVMQTRKVAIDFGKI
jgi:exosome complex RNA-binding protein Rrp42 (RNase PH superfamily)